MRTPLDPIVLGACCGLCRRWATWALAEGHPSVGFEWLTLGCLLAVGFYGMLRPGELAALTPELVRGPSGAPHEEPWAIVAIRRPKNKRAMGRVQFATIRDEATTRWLAWITAEHRPLDPLWPRGYRNLAVRFKQLVDTLGLKPLNLTLASLRAGGCTHYSRSGVDPGV